MWLRGLFASRPAAPSAPPRTRSPEGFAEHENRVLAEFEKTYGITFGNRALLKLALTHRSYLHVTGAGPRDSNERLEFLGDSVLGLVTSEHLYRKNPNEHEGQLTKTKSLLVSKAILSRRALAMGLGRYVLMSHSEVESGGRQRLSILADAFEAVIGSIYLDQGFGAARSFIERWLLREARVIAADKRHTNYKSHLQEYVQSTFRTHPVYRIRSAMGPDHSKQFMVEVMVGRKVLGEGRGRNKKEAEQAAARDALEQVGATPEPERAPASTGERAERTDRTERTAESRPSRRSEPDRDDDDKDDDSQHRRARRGGRGDGERGESGDRGERRAPAAPPPPPPPRPARPAPPPPPPRPVKPRRKFDEDEHDEIGRPEGPAYAGESFEPREPITTPLPPVAIEPSSSRTAEPEPERDWDRPVPAFTDDEESEDMPEIDVPTSYAEPPPPDEPPPSRTVEPAPPATTESQSFGRRPRRPGGR